MRRQLYRGGGITSLYPRKKFGIGSWFQETKDKIVDRTRKLIPNELADVAVKAAPFVAMIPGGAPYAGIMRGLGRLDQRGDLTDAIKQGALTYGFGKYVAPTIRQGASNLYEGLTPTATAGTDAARTIGMSGAPGGGDPSMFLKPASDQSFLNKVLFGKEGGGVPVFGDKGLIGAGGNFSMKEAFGKGVPAVFAGSTIAAYAAQKALGDVGERESGESLEAYNKRRKGTVGQYLDFYYRRANKFRIPPEEMDAAAAKFVADNTKEYVSQGGRIGQMRGTGPNGLPGIPRMAPDGMEFDMRQNGGFQPLGAKEKKDDVPAMLAKNEFVFTADAVRGAGNGDIELGAQKMYDTMKNLERRVT